LTPAARAGIRREPHRAVCWYFGGIMSVKVMGLVWDSDLPRDQKFILLAYADHADHEGRDVYPSVPLVSWKTGYSERQVQRITGELVQALIMVEDGYSQFGTIRYFIDLEKLPKRPPFKSARRGRPPKMGVTVSPIYGNIGDAMSPNLEKMGDISAENGDIPEKWVTKTVKMGDIAMSPEPSLTVIKPSIEPKDAHFWEFAREQLKQTMPKGPYDRYVRGLVFLGRRDGLVQFGAPTAEQADWCAGRLSSTLAHMLAGAYNEPVQVSFVAGSMGLSE
jgi:hypothetical protein